jgi:hypothetical protein
VCVVLHACSHTLAQVTVTVVALSRVGLEPWQVMLSTLMIVMGFIVYYLMPYSFIFQNIPLFLFLLTVRGGLWTCCRHV